MLKTTLLFSVFLLLFGCVNPPRPQLSQDEIDAKIEAARKTDSLLNLSQQIEESRNLAQAFAGIHVHGLGGSGNLAFDAHQDPDRTRQILLEYEKLAERYAGSEPKIREARLQMIRNFQEEKEEEMRRIY